MKHDAKLAHQNLRLSRGTDVFTIPSGGRGVSVHVTFFYASGPPVVKLDAILFGVSCGDDFLYVDVRLFVRLGGSFGMVCRCSMFLNVCWLKCCNSRIRLECVIGGCFVFCVVGVALWRWYGFLCDMCLDIFVVFRRWRNICIILVCVCII